MSLISLLFPLFVYFLVALLGYSEYTDTNPNFLLALSDDVIGSFLFSLIYLSFLTVILMSFPLKFFQGRNVLLWMADKITGNE